jgi:hypothetical protein
MEARIAWVSGSTILPFFYPLFLASVSSLANFSVALPKARALIMCLIANLFNKNLAQGERPSPRHYINKKTQPSSDREKAAKAHHHVGYVCHSKTQGDLAHLESLGHPAPHEQRRVTFSS